MLRFDKLLFAAVRAGYLAGVLSQLRPIRCVHCGRQRPPGSDPCPHCGKQPLRHKQTPGEFWDRVRSSLGEDHRDGRDNR